MKVFYPWHNSPLYGMRLAINGKELPAGSTVEVWNNQAERTTDVFITMPVEPVPDMAVHSLDEVVRSWVQGATR